MKMYYFCVNVHVYVVSLICTHIIIIIIYLYVHVHDMYYVECTSTCIETSKECTSKECTCV